MNTPIQSSSVTWSTQNSSGISSQNSSIDFLALLDDKLSFNSKINTSSKSLHNINSNVYFKISALNKQQSLQNLTQTTSLNSDKGIKTENVIATFKCMTPHTQVLNNCFSNRVFFLDRGCSFKLKLLGSISSSESSIDEKRENLEEYSIKRYIGKTVTGWDERGMHYWLHKINKSNLRLPLLEEIVRDNGSWYHIHFCDSCTARLNISRYFSNENMKYTDNDFSLNDSNILSVRSKDDFAEENKTDKGSNQADENKTLDKPVKQNEPFCSDQYLNRIVYCYNTCGLEEKNTLADELKKPLINPFTKVIVYGTDPCGLNFPVDLGGKESEKPDLLDSCIQKEYGLNIANKSVPKITTSNCHSDDWILEVEEKDSKTSSSLDNNNGYDYTDSSSSTTCSDTWVAFSPDYSLPSSVKASKTTFDFTSSVDNFSDLSVTQDNSWSDQSINGSIEDTDPDSWIQCLPDCTNNLWQPTRAKVNLLQGNGNTKPMYGVISNFKSNHKNRNYKAYQINKNMLEIYKRPNKILPQKPRGQSLWSENCKKKKKYLKNVLMLSESTAIQLINVGNCKNNAVVEDSVNNNESFHSFSNLNLNINYFISGFQSISKHILLGVAILLILVFSYVLLEDMFVSSLVTLPHYKWYHFPE